MSRRASIAKKQKPKTKVKFPDELVFLDNMKDNDVPAMNAMLRRASLQMNINDINQQGLTPLHQGCIDGNFGAVRLLIRHGADVNKFDEDHWTPLHAACAEGHADIVRFLLKRGADRNLLTDEGERPIDLVEPDDFETLQVLLQDQAATTTTVEEDIPESEERERLKSTS